MHRDDRVSDIFFIEKTLENKEKALQNKAQEFLLKAAFHTIIGL